MKKALPFILFLLWAGFSFSQKKSVPASFCITKQEKELFNLINRIRKENGKTALALSASLSYVAKTHVNDLKEHHPDTSICNLSSWSNKGSWTPCCYNSYVPKPLCMKKKPRELTSFPYYGYEFVLYFEDGVDMDSLQKLIYETDELIDMILTKGAWKMKKWIIAGVGINQNYVSVWFAQRKDVIKPPAVCKGGEKSIKKTKPKKAAAVKKKNQKPTTHYYYVIHLSFKNKDNAKEALKRTRKNGFKSAGLLQSDGKYRLYLNRFKTSDEALKYREKLPVTFKESWIYKK